MVREKISFSFAGRAAVMLLAAMVSSVASNSSGFCVTMLKSQVHILVISRQGAAAVHII